jgi:hypothetical protein
MMTMRSRELMSTSACLAFIAFIAAALAPRPAPAAEGSDYERAPIHYSSTEPNDPVAQLRRRIERGEATLELTPRFGYLPAVLRELDVPASSQGLVFARNSLQRAKISPRTPRAIYFNDDVYVGFVQNGGLIELAAADPKLGAVFYTIDQEGSEAAKPAAADASPARFKPAQIVREFGRCLSCHDDEVQVDIPGFKVRSVFPDERGGAIAMGGFHITTHASPLADRWGGWYVTGSIGPQRSRGNSFFARGKGLAPPRPLDAGPETGAPLADLSARIDTSAYLTPHSDVVALIVLDHQLEAHNRLAWAAQETLRALHEKAEPATPGKSAMRRINSACEPLVEYLLFSGEAKLTSPVSGASPFAAEFAARGPRDSQGRSLRDFDLKSRLFRYPLSYLIYSPTFDGLPPLAKERVYRRLWEVLSGESPSKKFDHLSPADRRAIVEILRQTKPGLPEHWLASANP